MRSTLYSAVALTLGLGLIAAVGAADKVRDKTPPKDGAGRAAAKGQIGDDQTLRRQRPRRLGGRQGSLWSVQNGEIVGKSKARSRSAPIC